MLMTYNGSLDPQLNRQAIKLMSKAIVDSNLKFDFIVFRGISGALLAAPLSLALNKRLVNVRKVEEKAHGAPVDGNSAGKYIVVDDFIVTGETMDAIFIKVPKDNCLCIFLTGPTIAFSRRDYLNVPINYCSLEVVDDTVATQEKLNGKCDEA